jgi:hypothetical protein
MELFVGIILSPWISSITVKALAAAFGNWVIEELLGGRAFFRESPMLRPLKWLRTAIH